MDRTIVWFRNDLRLHDHPLLQHPLARARPGREILYVYCADPKFFSSRLRVTGLPKIGSLRSAFLKQSVLDLRKSLRQRGSELLVFALAAAAALQRLAAAAAAATGEAEVRGKAPKVQVLVTAGVTPEEQQEEAAVEAELSGLSRGGALEAGLSRIWGLTLYHVEDLPYSDVRAELPMVFAPFGRAVRGNFRAADAEAVSSARRGEVGVPIREVLPTPGSLVPASGDAVLDNWEDLEAGWPASAEVGGQPPPSPSFGKEGAWWTQTFQGGETAGLQRLADFLANDVRRYKDTRNGLIGLRYSSKLSPWIALGCVSPRLAASKLRDWELQNGRSGEPTPSTAHWLSEFGWRDYLIFLAWKCGSRLFQLRGPGRVEGSWRRDQEMTRRVLEGRTGLPLVDAAIREMIVSGFMSNRARQFVASYIIVDLSLDWRIGAELFESYLIDYDVHANWGNWMRAAGIDGQGFGHSGSRWFNLDEERRRFDPHGRYVHLWVAELAQVPADYVHTPWTMTAQEQQRTGCVIGEDYPACPESPSKMALEGSDVSAEFPQLFSTTREGKMKGKGKGPGKGKEGKHKSKRGARA